MQVTHSQTGFTLIELAIVLFILGLLLASILPPLSAQIEQKERQQTQAQLEEIKEVLYGFTLNQNSDIQKNRFPCPDCRDNSGTCATMTENDGIEDILAATCASEVGNLPWITLGVRETDAWGQRFTYSVTNDFADNTDGALIPLATCTSTTLDVSFSLCSDGDTQVYSSNAAAVGADGDVAQDLPVIVISHGRNWADAPTAEEEENYDDSTVATDILKKFVYRNYSAHQTTGFDDMMIWISPHILRTKMLNAGILP